MYAYISNGIFIKKVIELSIIWSALLGEHAISESIYPVRFFLTAIRHKKVYHKPDETKDFPVGGRQELPTGIISLSAYRQANFLFPVDLIL